MSDDGLPWFPCKAGKLIGALVALPHDEQVVYNMVLLRIYEKGGPVEETEATLARRTDTPRRRIEIALASLIEKGKIIRLSGEFLDSKSTHETLAEMASKKESAKTSAKTRWKKPQRKQQTDDANALLFTFTDTIQSESNDSLCRRKRLRTALKSDAKPDEQNVSDAEKAGLNGQFKPEWDKFVNYHVAKGSLMADWHAAWRTWCGNVQQYQPRGSSARIVNLRDAKAVKRAEFDAEMKELERRERGGNGDETERSNGCGLGPYRNAFDLSDEEFSRQDGDLSKRH